jgi:cellulase/cellobiase CelA1
VPLSAPASWGLTPKATTGGFREAPLWLKPRGSAGKPTKLDQHFRGELYMNSAAMLFVCTPSGNPGTWKQVTTTPA